MDYKWKCKNLIAQFPLSNLQAKSFTNSTLAKCKHLLNHVLQESSALMHLLKMELSWNIFSFIMM